MLTSVLVKDHHTGTDSFAVVSACAQLARTLQWCFACAAWLHMACRAVFSKMLQKHDLLCQPDHVCRHYHAKVLAEQWLSRTKGWAHMQAENDGMAKAHVDEAGSVLLLGQGT